MKDIRITIGLGLRLHGVWKLLGQVLRNSLLRNEVISHRNLWETKDPQSEQHRLEQGLGEPLWSPSREAGDCLGAAVDGTGKGLVAVMLDRVYGKEWNERKV